jgi:hypothetical protein
MLVEAEDGLTTGKDGKAACFVHFHVRRLAVIYWLPYVHCQPAPSDSYNPLHMPAVMQSRVDRNTCLLCVDHECLSAGTHLSCPYTPQPSSQSWVLPIHLHNQQSNNFREEK